VPKCDNNIKQSTIELSDGYHDNKSLVGSVKGTFNDCKINFNFCFISIFKVFL